MSAWSSVDLGDAMLAAGPLAAIEARFWSAFEAAGRPPEMAVFVRHESGSLHCAVKIYFSPAAAAVATASGATECARPSANGLSLLAGSNDSWPVLFPGERARGRTRGAPP